VFFLADGMGGSAFAETREAHHKNIARWCEIAAQAGEERATGVQGE
jgi:cell division protein YceG involved in septum cleavage